MSLSTSLSVALSGLNTATEQLAVVSRNVARSGEEGATRKVANVSTLDSGGSRISSVVRLANPSLLEKVLSASSNATGQRVIADALNQIDPTINDPSLDGSPSGLLATLTSALQTFATAPQDATAANAAVSAAKDMAQGLQDASTAVQYQRSLADKGIEASVNTINDLLTEFQALNDSIVKGSAVRADVTDTLDQRDQLIQRLSEEIGIRTVVDGSNSMSIFTEQGVTLFNQVPRSVSFQNVASFGPSTTGNAVYVDGVAITGTTGSMRSQSGRLVGYATVRDNLGVSYQNQLDELARGLVEAFAETDPNGVQPPTLGLFTYGGAPDMPASGVNAGLAATISVNTAVDPSQGGSALLLRDGGINGAAYVQNTTGASGYSDRLQELISGLTSTRSFDQAALLSQSDTLGDFASSSAGWLQAQRKTAATTADYSTTLQQRATDALSKETGVNIDEEMTNMLQFERAYQASARIMTTIDAMFQTLLNMYR